MLDCACLAGVAALRHYRRPDVEVVGEDVIIVSIPVISLSSSVLEPGRPQSVSFVISRLSPLRNVNLARTDR
jgi:exosome complex RNA-binding protein Rrp42 (RNase PH superfamily)